MAAGIAELAQLNLTEPQQVNWENYNPGSAYQAPPPVVGPDGKPITYRGVLPKEFAFEADQDGNLVAVIDPIVLTQSGTADGYAIKFTRVSTKLFQRNGKTVNASMFGNLLRAAGCTAKPQTNKEYAYALQSIGGRVVPFTIDWFARNKDTGEKVQGYLAFPQDPERPGLRKAILKAGDVVNVLSQDRKTIVGTSPIVSEVLFANAQVKYFIDPSRK